MKNDNKGFSLIELIVVIAIMAILVGALAPQLIKYIEKSRVAADQQALGAVYTAVQTAIADPTVDGAYPFSAPVDILSLPDTAGTGLTSLRAEVTSTLGDLSKVKASIKSTNAKGQNIMINVGANGVVTVTCGNITVNANGSTVS